MPDFFAPAVPEALFGTALAFLAVVFFPREAGLRPAARPAAVFFFVTAFLVTRPFDFFRIAFFVARGFDAFNAFDVFFFDVFFWTAFFAVFFFETFFFATAFRLLEALDAFLFNTLDDFFARAARFRAGADRDLPADRRDLPAVVDFLVAM